jgi:hypothetical protein
MLSVSVEFENIQGCRCQRSFSLELVQAGLERHPNGDNFRSPVQIAFGRKCLGLALALDS